MFDWGIIEGIGHFRLWTGFARSCSTTDSKMPNKKKRPRQRPFYLSANIDFGLVKFVVCADCEIGADGAGLVEGRIEGGDTAVGGQV